MALRDQPYLPLYVQDFLTDEKLMECSAESTGVYIRLMCLMHKSEHYGRILLKQKDKQMVKQKENICLMFATKLARHMPYEVATINDALTELIQEQVIQIDSESINQKRMIRDCELSIKRANAGSDGGKKTQEIAKEFAKAKVEANAEIENEIQKDREKGVGKGEENGEMKSLDELKAQLKAKK